MLLLRQSLDRRLGITSRAARGKPQVRATAIKLVMATGKKF